VTIGSSRSGDAVAGEFFLSFDLDDDLDPFSFLLVLLLVRITYLEESPPNATGGIKCA
jgi:hypothetical protein